MANINLKNFPAETHELLKKQALMNHRSLNKEILHILDEAVMKGSQSGPEDSLLARVQETGKKFKGTMTNEEFDAAKREGRP